MPATLISIVTFNSQADIAACLDAALAQTSPVRVRVFDNASQDDSVAIARQKGVETLVSPVNLGFSAGHNRLLRETDFEWALVLNPDCVIAPDFVAKLLQAARSLEGVGMVGGKLHRMDERGRPLTVQGAPLIDSAGIYLVPSQRHLDRGAGEPDQGQFDRRQLVFGITGAAVLLSKKMLEDLRFEDEYFDEDFFAYREDADLAWRAQWAGWKALYEPLALGRHRRRVLPERRRRIEDSLNRHSLKNRYLMRAKNFDRRLAWKCFPWAWLRDLGILGYVLLKERTSLKAYQQARALKPRMLRKRDALPRRVSGGRMAEWFTVPAISAQTNEFSAPTREHGCPQDRESKPGSSGSDSRGAG